MLIGPWYSMNGVGGGGRKRGYILSYGHKRNNVSCFHYLLI